MLEGETMPPKGMIPPMVQKMMEEMEGSNPMEMCRSMMASVSQSADLASFATPEVRGLLEEWMREVEREMLQYLSEHTAVTPEELAQRFKVSKESALFFLMKLAREGRVTLGKIAIDEVRTEAAEPPEGGTAGGETSGKG